MDLASDPSVGVVAQLRQGIDHLLLTFSRRPVGEHVDDSTPYQRRRVTDHFKRPVPRLGNVGSYVTWAEVRDGDLPHSWIVILGKPKELVYLRSG